MYGGLPYIPEARCIMAVRAMKSERLEVRISHTHKALIEEAAALSGQALTTFAVSTLVERAEGILRRHETTVLSARDRELFLRILDDEKPAAALRKAARRFKARQA